MSKVEQLAQNYGRHIALPWQLTVSGAQRVIMIVYDRDLERALLARRAEFENATRRAGHRWAEFNVAGAFSEWMAADEYRDAYFESPEDLQLKLEAEFTGYVAGRIREKLTAPEADGGTVVGLFGVGALFGFTHVSQVLKLVEPDIRGRLVVFFPGAYDRGNYRLLNARDGWNYLAVPITLHTTGAL